MGSATSTLTALRPSGLPDTPRRRAAWLGDFDHAQFIVHHIVATRGYCPPLLDAFCSNRCHRAYCEAWYPTMLHDGRGRNLSDHAVGEAFEARFELDHAFQSGYRNRVVQGRYRVVDVPDNKYLIEWVSKPTIADTFALISEAQWTHRTEEDVVDTVSEKSWVTYEEEEPAPEKSYRLEGVLITEF